MGPLPLPPERRLWGAHLFVPANRAGFLTRLPLLGARSVILDLEYATHLDRKVEARYLAAEAIAYLRALRPDLAITLRINAPAAGRLAERDLEVVAPAGPDAIRVPAVEDAAALRRIDRQLRTIEGRIGAAEGSIALHPMIESPRGLRRVASIAGASARNEALCLGGEDWAQSVGAIRTRAGHELDHVRAALVAAAAEHGLVAVDSVYNWLDDPEGLAADCRRSAALGFRGRATIHPGQLAIIEAAYRPTPARLEAAQRLLDGLVAVDLDGVRVPVSGGVLRDPAAVFQARLTRLQGLEEAR